MSSDNSVATATLKVLASGDVDGRFAAFLKRLEAVEKKAGPFEMVLCVGRDSIQYTLESSQKIFA